MASIRRRRKTADSKSSKSSATGESRSGRSAGSRSSSSRRRGEPKLPAGVNAENLPAPDAHADKLDSLAGMSGSTNPLQGRPF